MHGRGAARRGNRRLDLGHRLSPPPEADAEDAARRSFAPELVVEAIGDVRLVTLNRPDVLNATNLLLHEALGDVWGQLAADPAARAIVVTGAGRAFSAGGDLQHIQRMQDDVTLRRHEMTRAAMVVREMSRCPLPIVGAINGPAVGLGATLAVLCDIVLMSDQAYIADPHVSVGLTAADGGVSLWPMHMSLHRAKEYLLTGDRIPATVAVQIGLANRVVPADALLAEAMALAQRLARQPRQAVESTKRMLNEHLVRAVGDILELALEQEYRSFDEPEHRAVIAGLLGRPKREQQQ